MTHDEGERTARLEAELTAAHQIMAQQSHIIAQQERLLAAAAEIRAHMSSDTQSDVLECGMIVGARDAIGGSQGFRPLPVVYVTKTDDYGAEHIVNSQSAWEFSKSQREKVAAGAPLILIVEGRQPPVMLYVGERAEVDPTELYTTEWLNDRDGGSHDRQNSE